MTPPGCTKVKAFMDFLIPRLDLKRIDSKGARPEADAAYQALLRRNDCFKLARYPIGRSRLVRF